MDADRQKRAEEYRNYMVGTEKGKAVGPLDVVACYALPCPFCGSAAVLDYDDEDRKMAIKPFYKCSDVEKCRVFGPDGETVTEALERWNQRTRCDFCRETPLTPTEHEHMESILHNVKEKPTTSAP